MAMEKTEKLILIGSGELAQIAFEYFTWDSPYEVVAFSVDREYITDTSIAGLPVVPYDEVSALYPPDKFHAFAAIPASQLNRLRRRFYTDLKASGYRLASYVSSHAFVWRNVPIGENTFIFENNVLQPFVQVGNNCILWSGNHVGHRTVIRDHNFITSHVVISGYCDIGEGSFIGVNATLNDRVKIGQHGLIGAGAHVVKDTDPEKLYVGQPARAVPGKSSYDVEL
jgi:sugar O-acyltransferase (sialic acid O-acetyltransferase NeuD family)